MAAELDYVASVEELNLAPEDDDLLSFYCAGESDIPLIRDSNTSRPTSLSGFEGSQAIGGNKRSIETASNGSSELDGPDRRRKKQYLELLEGKVAQLTEEIDEAREVHLDSADSTINALKNQLVTSLNKLLDNYPPNTPLPPSVDAEVRAGVHSIQDRFGPNAKVLCLSANVLFYNHRRRKGKLDGDRKDSVAKKDGLWSALSTELGLTYEQEEKIKGHYRASDSKTAKLERRKIAMAVTYLHQLKVNMAERSEAVQSYSDSIQSILSPDQTIRYQQWAMTNRTTHSDMLKENGLQFAPSSGLDPSAKISTILHKEDRDLTVEDVTSLLATLSKKAPPGQDQIASTTPGQHGQW
ncbi:hypothetical protein DYB32_001507 [Aphanomyces invadans]|uniref:Uncharacterized protein n=1 Tax=Aphanomyces invadans TaxID=157072 RepID=A0A3R7AE37_9STRA|nr:hypothetical protein DYB32_001507 [Aphanomyces invadans]